MLLILCWFALRHILLYTFSAQPATAYPAAAPTAYVAQPAHQAAYATAAPRAAQSYDAYQTTHTAGQYAYATRTQVVVGVSVGRD